MHEYFDRSNIRNSAPHLRCVMNVICAKNSEASLNAEKYENSQISSEVWTKWWPKNPIKALDFKWQNFWRIATYLLLFISIKKSKKVFQWYKSVWKNILVQWWNLFPLGVSLSSVYINYCVRSRAMSHSHIFLNSINKFPTVTKQQRSPETLFDSEMSFFRKLQNSVFHFLPRNLWPYIRLIKSYISWLSCTVHV